jgi:hypothetical protein
MTGRAVVDRKGLFRKLFLLWRLKRAKISCFDHENFDVNKFTLTLFLRRVHHTANWQVPPDQYA